MSDSDDQDSVTLSQVAARYERLIGDVLNKRDVEELREIVLRIESKLSSKAPHEVSAMRRLAADALRRARRLPPGHDRNDLRQIAIGLLWLDKRGLSSNALRRVNLRDGNASSHQE